MIGIYKITNLETGEVYIGQSKNIERRRYQHWHNSQTDIGRAIQANPDNFQFDVLEECPVEKLNEREEFYTKEYLSNMIGYNHAVVYSQKGATNPNHKLHLVDVMAIRMAYQNHENKQEVYEQYKDFIGWRGFEKVWQGETWTDVMMDVYTEENKAYYTHQAKSNPQDTVFTDQEVLEFRNRYVNETCREIYESINGQERCAFSTFEGAVIGTSHKNIPIYRKKEKRWININL